MQQRLGWHVFNHFLVLLFSKQNVWKKYGSCVKTCAFWGHRPEARFLRTLMAMSRIAKLDSQAEREAILLSFPRKMGFLGENRQVEDLKSLMPACCTVEEVFTELDAWKKSLQKPGTEAFRPMSDQISVVLRGQILRHPIKQWIQNDPNKFQSDLWILDVSEWSSKAQKVKIRPSAPENLP